MNEQERRGEEVRRSYVIRYKVADWFLENVFTHLRGPFWPKTLAYMDRLQKREHESGREWRFR